MQNRRGLSIVEVLVALLVVSVGVLAMAGSSALTVRVAGAAARERRAAERAASRVASLAAQGCGTAHDGSYDDAVAPLQERWTVKPVAHGMAEVSVLVTWPAPAGPRSFSLGSALLC